MQAEHIPDFSREELLWRAGSRRVAGIDEAGRGALAGPVVAAAVVPPHGAHLFGVWAHVRDSKLLTPERRETLAEQVMVEATAWALGEASADEVDRFGISKATRTAMVRAVAGLAREPSHLFIDWVKLPELPIAQTCWAKADRSSVSVAAASILAKVYRDRMMSEIDVEYPVYGFARHKGYGTPQHLAALSECGPSPVHRFSFAPVAQCRSLFNASITVGGGPGEHELQLSGAGLSAKPP